jgi:hypothetical protein
MADDLEDAIRENAEGPLEAHGDSGGMKQHKLTDHVAADRYLEGKKASRRKGLPIGLKKLVPPGTD